MDLDPDLDLHVILDDSKVKGRGENAQIKM